MSVSDIEAIQSLRVTCTPTYSLNDQSGPSAGYPDGGALQTVPTQQLVNRDALKGTGCPINSATRPDSSIASGLELSRAENRLLASNWVLR
jgi:hypothetical protein